MRQVGPVMSRLTAHGAEPRAARLAGHDGGRARARAQQPGRGGQARGVATSPRRSTSIGSTLGAFVEAGVEREEADELVALQHEALERAARPHAARRARRRRRRGRAARRARGRSAWPTPWRLGRAAGGRRASTPPGCPSVARARRPGDRTRAALGRRVADRARAGRRAARSRPSA